MVKLNMVPLHGIGETGASAAYKKYYPNVMSEE